MKQHTGRALYVKRRCRRKSGDQQGGLETSGITTEPVSTDRLPIAAQLFFLGRQ